MDTRNEHATHNPFKHASDGLMWAIKSQPNYRIHVIMSIIAVSVGVFFKVSQMEWIVIAVLITMGLVIEAFNTAIEATNNAISTEWKQEIKIAKDVSAAAMLTYVIGVIVITGLIFLPKILQFIN